jgi:hypothetical protein
MKQEEDGGRAFPCPQLNAYGMSLRDYFAGQALTGMLATYGPSAGEDGSAEHVEFLGQLAGDAYQLADAMLKARTR